MAGDDIQGSLHILFAGGGTGGHLFPGIAIAQEFVERDPRARILFIGAGKAIEKSILKQQGFPHKRISSEGIKGRRWWHKMRSLSKLPVGLLQSLIEMIRFHPDLVVGLGGYSAAPVVTAAWLTKRKVILQEQNILPGITNRMLAPMADRIYVSFEKTRTHFNERKVRITGNPVRRSLIQAAAKEHASAGTAKQPFTVLVLGGSQGAHRMNTTVPEALRFLEEKDRLRIIHQTGVQDEAEVSDSYRQQSVNATVKAFFDDMAALYSHADLVICRAGATTVAEITAMGMAAIFIPFPFAADNHQVLNARELEDAGAAEVILETDLTAKRLADRIGYYANSPKEHRRMAEVAKKHGKPMAAKTIVDDCYELLGVGQ